MRREFARRQVVEDPVRSMPFIVPMAGRPLSSSAMAHMSMPPAIKLGLIVVAHRPISARPRPPAADATMLVTDELTDLDDEHRPDEPAAYRTLLPGPGVCRVVRWGDFKSMLGPQMAHADRLHDTHRLPCYAQVYEVSRSQRVEALATALLGTPEHAGQLRPLTPDIATRLGLMPLLAHGPGGRRGRPVPGMLIPHERVVHLQVATDPTRMPQGQEPVRAASDLCATERLAGGGALDTQPRSDIPERFLKPWEFRLSREEAVYDMQAAAPRFPTLAGFLHRFAGWFGRRDDFGKWRALLAGKSRDEQLWAVRPPRGSLSHPAVRDWATRVLELAGYNPRMMLAEWEIFWRRRGL